MKQTRRESKRFHAGSDCQKTYPAESFGGKNSVKGNRHTEPQRGVSERNRRIAAALGAEMGSLSRSITRRSDQNCKIILQTLILQFCRQLVKKVQKDFFDKLTRRESKRFHAGFHIFQFVNSGRRVACCSKRASRELARNTISDSEVAEA